MTINDNLVEVFHELKNPLATIKINLELMKEYEQKKQKKNFEVIENEVNKIENIVKKYISFTKDKHLEKDCIYFADIIKNIISENKISYPDIKFEIDGDEELYILAYEYHIYMIFSNIIKNAIEAINGVGNIHTSIFEKEGIVNIHIKDDGVGIQDFNKLKNKFYTTKSNGSGIGTTIISNTVDIYNGNFHLKNNKNSGATAIIEIPLS